MEYKRASKGNVKGIEKALKGADPLKQKIVMMRVSMAKALKQKSHDSGKSESEIVRNALEVALS
jgi:hypothetical protein